MSAPGARGRAHRLRIRSRWWAGAVVVGLLGASGTGAQAPNDAEAPIRGDLEDADRRIDRFRERLESEVRSMRAALDHDHATADRGTLLERKRTVDMALSPMLLLIDAAAAAAGDRDDADLLRALRVEWRADAATAEWSPAAAGARARRSIGEWLDSLAAATADGSPVRAEAVTTSMRWTGCDAPLSIGWSIDATRGASGGAVSELTARAWWRVPLAEQAAIDFPLDPDGLEIRWDPTGASVADDRGAWHREDWSGIPLFNNPPDLWAVHDTLRACRAADGAIGGVEGADRPHEASDPLRRGAPAIDERAIRTVRRSDGSTVRRETWCWADGALRSISIEIHPMRLVHHAPHGFRLVTEVDGHVDTGEDHRPSHELIDVPGGARLEIVFPEQRGGAASTTMDTTVEWVDSDGVRARAVIRPRGSGTDGLRSAMNEHRAAADAIVAGMVREDGAAMDRAIDGILACHANRLSHQASAAAEWVLLAKALRARGLDATALRAESIAAGTGTPAMPRPPCIDGDDAPVTDTSAATESMPSESWSADGCGSPELPAGAAALVAAIHLESVRSGRGGDGLHAIIAAVCTEARQEWSPHAGRMQGADAGDVAWFSAEYREALDAGVLEWPADAPGVAPGEEGDARRLAIDGAILARRIMDAVAAGPMDANRRERARRSHDAAARTVMDALRAMLLDGEGHAMIAIDRDAAARLFARDRALIGNPLVGADPPGTPEGIAGIEAIVRAERVRIEAIERAAGPRLAAARARVAAHRILAAAGTAALGMVQASLPHESPSPGEAMPERLPPG